MANRILDYQGRKNLQDMEPNTVQSRTADSGGGGGNVLRTIIVLKHPLNAKSLISPHHPPLPRIKESPSLTWVAMQRCEISLAPNAFLSSSDYWEPC